MDTGIQGSWIQVSRALRYRYPGLMDTGFQGSWIMVARVRGYIHYPGFMDTGYQD